MSLGRSSLLVLKIGVTTTALILIIQTVPWRDQVVLTDDRTGTLIKGNANTVDVRIHNSAATESLPASSVRNVEPGFRSIVGRIRPEWVLAWLACTAISAGLLVSRWHYVLGQVSEKPPPASWCGVIWARSQVINLLPLSQIGGDAYRMQRAVRPLGGAASSAGVIALERLIGLIALLSVMMIGWAASGRARWPFGVMIVVGCAGAWITVAALAGRIRNRPRPAAAPQRLRRGGLTAFVLPLAHLVRNPCAFAFVLAMSVTAHLLTAASFLTVDRALGLNTPVWAYWVAIPLVSLAQFLPIHIAGIGVLEGGLYAVLSTWTSRSWVEVASVSTTARIALLLWTALLSLAFIVDPVRTNKGISCSDVRSSGSPGPGVCT
ncbi:MAG: lysylphosphatidylglycerol synthase transmembrane domain-containing protein [Hyphomicrobium sp.]